MEFYRKNAVLTALALEVPFWDRSIRTKISSLLFCCLLQLVPSALKGETGTGAVILQYHHVSAETPAVTSISPEKFKAHIETIITQGYQVMPLTTIVDGLRKGGNLPDKAVAITFDDAYKNIFTHAFPILKKYRLPFTVFVATDYIAEPSTQFLSWDELREMSINGAFIANHTASHSHLLRRQQGETQSQWLNRVEQEILIAEKALHKNINSGPVQKLLAYPYGEYDTNIQRIIKKLGYVAFGQQSGAAGSNSDFSALPRFPLSGIYSDHESFAIKLNTLPLPIKNQPRDPLLRTDNPMPRLVMSFEDGDVNLSNLRCFGPEGALEIQTLDKHRVSTRVTTPLPIGRSRYNCTMPVPGADPERFYWFSQLWIRTNIDGSWYPEL
ncbi:MAG: polysaccharide deacetylase family protein [Gammaproteobacteria bacterium]|nr:polysaccharide deacetylase family protein [Gammaproteobacteria bacterium]